MPRRTIPRPYPADMPGVTVEWLARANSCSPRTIRRWRASPSPDSGAIDDVLVNLTTELAKEMALLRPRRGTLPFWSRLAIAELAQRGATYSDLMRLFRVGRSTVYRAIHRTSAAYCPLSGRRLPSSSQSALKWHSAR
jgi:transposase-like protein